MSFETPIEQLLRDSRIWQAGRPVADPGVTLSSGWPKLDEALNGGWPLGQLIEVLLETHGVGELALLLPALSRLTTRRDAGLHNWVILVAPPFLPYAPALARAGMDLSRLLLVRPRQDVEALWATEQALRGQACAAVVCWSRSASASALRRLQLAAEASGAWSVLLRPAHLQASRSPAPLRIRLGHEQDGDRLVLNVLKRRGGPPCSLGLDIGSP